MDTTYERKLREMARLAIARGVALQPGELVGIGAPVSCYHFVEMLEEEAFRAGATNVYVQWEDRHLREQRILHAQEEMLRSVPTWERSGLDHVVSSGGSLIQVRSPLFEDFPPEAASRASLMQTSDDEANQILMNTKMSFTTPWVILLLPNQRWAKKVYPDLPDEEAYRTLADSLMDCARIQTEGTIQAWDAHCAELKRRADLLAGKNIRTLHYQNSLGTDFTVGLAEPQSWTSGAVDFSIGRRAIPNIPTEEVATVPLVDSAHGDVVATKPLLFGHDIICGMRLHFENGEVTSFSAEKGEDALARMLKMDANGAGRRLGEVALVPHSSQISQKNVVFYSTILDENASCHLALGNAYGAVRPGVNKGASYHADFMVGSADLNITAHCADGQEHAIFRNGEWAF